MNVRPLLAFLTLFSAMTLQAETKPASKHDSPLRGRLLLVMEAVFQRLPGIVHSTSGYAGGTTATELRGSRGHGTGHAESSAWNLTRQSATRSARVFFERTIRRRSTARAPTRRPISLNHPVRERGQQAAAGKAKLAAQAHSSDPIVTEIVPLKKFWRAEAIIRLLQPAPEPGLLHLRHQAEGQEAPRPRVIEKK